MIDIYDNFNKKILVFRIILYKNEGAYTIMV